MSLSINDFNKFDINSLKKSKRTYRNVKIAFFSGSQKFGEFKTILKKFGKNIERLAIFRTSLDYIDYAFILKSVPNVEFLEFTDIQEHTENYNVKVLPSFPKLKEVRSLECFPAMFKLLKNSEITTFYLNYNQDIFTMLSDVVDFLCSQKQLKSFTMDQIQDTNYFCLSTSSGSFSNLQHFKMVIMNGSQF